MDDEIGRMELDFFQGRTEIATESALRLLKGLDADDDDDAETIERIVTRGLSSSGAEHFADSLLKSGFDGSVTFPNGNGIINSYAEMGRSDPKVFRLLMDMNSDPTRCDRSGRNYLHQMANLERSMWGGDREKEVAEIAGLLDDVSEWMSADAFGATPLHLAVLNDHRELVESLLENGADACATGTAIRQGYGHVIDFEGIMPLHLACLVGNVAIAEMLISHGADSSARDSRGRTAAHYAVSAPPVHFCRVYDSIPGKDSVHEKKTRILEMLDDIDSADDGGVTPLILSLDSFRYGDGVGTALAGMGVDLERPDNRGRTPLIVAATNGHKDAVKTIVSSGADLDRKGPAGRTALHMAIDSGDEKISRYLIKKGARFDIPDDGGATAMSMAADSGLESVLELMI